MRRVEKPASDDPVLGGFLERRGDADDAKHWYRRASEAGHAGATAALGTPRAPGVDRGDRR